MSAVGDAVIHYSAAPEPPIPAVSLSEHVLGAAPERGSAPAIIDGQTGAVTTYEQLARNVKSLSAGLAGAGAGPGTVLALMSPNRPEYPQVLYAASATGATVSPIGVLATEDDVARQLSDSRARVLVVAESLRDTAIAAAATAGVQGVYVIGEPGEARSLSELYGDPADAPRPHIDPATDVAALPYSSGTTGLSKGVMLSHRNLIANIEQLAGHHQITPSDVLLPAVPFFHIYGMNVVLGAGLAAGAALITLPRFDLDAFLTLIERHRVTRAFVAPPVVLQLASAPQVSRHDLSSLKFVMSGAAPLDEDLARRAEARIGCPIIQGYGMTEASPGTHGVPDEEAGDTPPSSVGRLVAGTEARIVDPATTEDIDGRGEILIRGPQVMLGYHGQPAATAETIIEDGWLRTGDIGVVDERGDWYIVDRAKEVIKYKGYQVPPAELEAVLLGHPSISDAAVIGVPDAAGGEAPKAFIVADGELDAETVMAWVAARVSPYKRVRHVELVAEIPKSPTGKILRRLLRARTEAPIEPVHASQRKRNKMSTSPQTAARLVSTLAELPSAVGMRLGPSQWQTITQKQVDEFAELTGDHNFIHVDPERAATTMFKGTIAHGYLTLSLLAPITQELIDVTDAATSINYGSDKLRFPAPLPVGAEFRGSGEVTSVTEIKGGFELKATFAIEAKDAPKPALVTECLFRYYE